MDYDRAKEVKAFDESKAGVKGLIDYGLNKVPRIFIRPSEEIEADKLNKIQTNIQVPVINLDGIRIREERKRIIDDVSKASEKWGFFQVVNHGIPLSVLDKMISGIREFHEQDLEVKKAYYTRDQMKTVRLVSNYDLFHSRTANWRDTLTVSMLYKDQIDPDELPQKCRISTIEYIKHINSLAHTLLELLCEALGLDPNYLSLIESGKSKNFLFHYYPPCPEPDLTLGTGKHTDPTFITLLLQDQLGGLQVMHENQWVNVNPVAGGIVVNIGDLLQIASNDKFKSVEHRVVANQVGPRISSACFLFGAFGSSRLYGPIKQLLSEKNPPLFKDFTIEEFIETFYSRALETVGVDRFKL